MARYPPKRESPKVKIAPEPSKKKDEEEYVLVEPRDFRQAWIDVGLNQCVAYAGPGTDGNRKKYRGLKKELKEFQHYLTIKMRGKKFKIKRGASVQKDEEACYMPPNADGGYDVRMIINSRIIDGKLHYQVLWEGFPLEFATWEPTSMLHKAKAHVKKFHETFKRKAGDPRRGKHELLDSNESDKSEVEMDENVVEVNSRRMGLGGEAAQAMQLIPAPPRRKRTPGGVKPSRKSARHAPQIFESLDIHPLAAGKVKKIDADEDVDEEETPSFNERKSCCRRGKRAAIGEYASDSDGGEDVEMIDTLSRANKTRIRRHDKKSVVDSSSDAGTEDGLLIRKKAKKVAADASAEVGTAIVDGECLDSGLNVPSTRDDFDNLYNDAMGFYNDDGNQADNNQDKDEDSDSDSSGDDNSSSESEEE